jgi:hypothetical protein
VNGSRNPNNLCGPRLHEVSVMKLKTNVKAGSNPKILVAGD